MAKSLNWSILSLLVVVVLGVDRSKFRTCQDTGFCRRHRGATGPLPGSDAAYKLDIESVRQADGQLFGKVVAGALSLKLLISVCRGGAVRVKITEEEDRWAPAELLTHEGLAAGEFTLLPAGDGALPTALQSLPASSLLALHFNSKKSDEDELAINDGPSILAFTLLR
jgi:hypothetical protein